MATRSALISLLAIPLLSTACYSSSPGVVRTSADNPLVVVGAGEIEVGSGAHYYARYIIDQRAQVCWFFAGDSVSAMDCCSLKRVPEAQPYLAWVSAASCSATPTIAPVATPAK
jgi:hypothetical protein